MITSFFPFTVFIIATSLLQVSFIPLPLGLVAILIWWLLHGTQDIIWLVLIFSVSLAAVSNLPAWAILLVTTASLYLFIFGRSFLPARPATTLGLLIVSVLTWEISLVVLVRLI